MELEQTEMFKDGYCQKCYTTDKLFRKTFHGDCFLTPIYQRVEKNLFGINGQRKQQVITYDCYKRFCSNVMCSYNEELVLRQKSNIFDVI